MNVGFCLEKEKRSKINDNEGHKGKKFLEKKKFVVEIDLKNFSPPQPHSPYI